MNAKKLIIKMATAAIMLPLLSCGNISEDDRYVRLDDITPARAVLLEEYTGQLCTNCPEGHAIVASLREQYGTAVIPVSIHASRLALEGGDLGGGQQGLANDQAAALFEAAGRPSLPAGTVDRTSAPIGRNEWAATVRQRLEEPSPVKIEATATIDGGQIDISITFTPMADINAAVNVWIVENGIQSLQYSGSDYILDYTHNHVFRSALTPVGTGESISLKDGVYATVAYTAVANPLWNPEDLAAVVFLQAPGGNVIQAFETQIITK